MIIKEAKYKKVKRIVEVLISDDVYGCDHCKKEIDDSGNLSIDVFFHDEKFKKQNINNTDKYDFCSWKCLITFLPKIKTDYFISMPFLHYDNKITKDGTSVKDFFDLFKDLDKTTLKISKPKSLPVKKVVSKPIKKLKK
jgi:hypothetical protein